MSEQMEQAARLGVSEQRHRARAARAPRHSRRRAYWLWLAARRRRERLELIYAAINGRRNPMVVTLPVRDVNDELKR